MLTRTKQKMFFVIISVLLELMAPKAGAIKLTLSDEGLMAIDEYSRHISGLTAAMMVQPK